MRLLRGMLAMVPLGFVFWRKFDPYVRSLLLDDERKQLVDSDERPVHAVATFGLAGLVAAVAFAVGAVFGLNGLLFVSGTVAAANFAGAAAAAAVGTWLWRKQKPGEAG